MATQAPIITTHDDDLDFHGEPDDALDEVREHEAPDPTQWERERVARILRELHHPPQRRWAYLRAARQATRYDNKKKRNVPLLTSDEVRLLYALVEYADPDLSSSFPGITRLARDEVWQARKIHYVLRGLEEKGWIVRTPRSGTRGDVCGNQFCVPAGALAPWSNAWTGPKPFSTGK